MDLLQAFVVGAVQGITEWLPISSEGMNSLVLTQFFGSTLAEAILISIWLHIGTFFAALIYLRKDVLHILKKRDQTFWFLVVATIVSLVIAAPLMILDIDFLVAGRSIMALIGILLVSTGMLQLYARKKGSAEKKITYKDAVLAGIAQGFAVLPGLSRSGLTISVLLLRKYTGKTSIKLSFLMSIPAIAIAGLWATATNPTIITTEGIAALVTSFILGLATIAALLKLSERINFAYFCLVIGALSILAGLV